MQTDEARSMPKSKLNELRRVWPEVPWGIERMIPPLSQRPYSLKEIIINMWVEVSDITPSYKRRSHGLSRVIG